MAQQPTRAQQLLGDLAPKMVELTDEVLFGDVWKRPGLSPWDRSLVTVAVLAATYRPGQLDSHLRLALANGVTKDELAEALTQLAFYAGWPSGMAALTQLKAILDGDADTPGRRRRSASPETPISCSPTSTTSRSPTRSRHSWPSTASTDQQPPLPQDRARRGRPSEGDPP